MRIFTKLGLRSISLFVKTRMDTILPKMKKKLQQGRPRKASGIPTKTCAKLFKKKVEVEMKFKGVEICTYGSYSCYDWKQDSLQPLV